LTVCLQSRRMDLEIFNLLIFSLIQKKSPAILGKNPV
jgi:hypothetical protein